MLSVRADFPYLRHHPELVYLDSAATSQKPQVVVDALNRYYCEFAANVHRGGYSIGEKATAEWERARSQVANFLGATSEREIVFTKGATEGLNLLANLLLDTHCSPGDSILISNMEHHSNLLPWQVQSKRRGILVEVAQFTPEGLFDLSPLESLIAKKPRLVSLTACSNVFGMATQIQDIVKLARSVGALVVVDAVQLGLHRQIDVQDLGCDFLVISGHKLLGPTGIGALWGRGDLLDELPPWHYGGEMVEEVTLDSFQLRPYPWKFEGGTPPIAEAIGFGAALDYITALGTTERVAHSTELTRRLFQIFAEYPEIEVYGSTDPALRFGSVIFNIKGVHAHDLVSIFNSCGVAVRAGGHCAHPVMQQLGVHSTARISFGPYNELSELDTLKTAIERVLRVFKKRT